MTTDERSREARAASRQDSQPENLFHLGERPQHGAPRARAVRAPRAIARRVRKDRLRIGTHSREMWCLYFLLARAARTLAQKMLKKWRELVQKDVFNK